MSTPQPSQPSLVPLGTVVGVMCSCVLALAVIETLPALIGILGTHYRFPPRDLGALAAAVLVCYIAGTYLTNGLTVERLARLTPWACFGTAAINLGCIAMLGKVPLYLVYPLSALGGGICYGYMLKVIDLAGQQRRSMGIYLALINFNVFTGFQVITFATETLAHFAVFVVYAVCAVVAGILTIISRQKVIASPERTAHPHIDETPSPLPRRLAACACMLAVSYVAFGVVWPFVQMMGTSKGYTPFMIADALSAYSVTAIVGSLSAAALPACVNPIAVLLFALGVVLVSIELLCGSDSYLLFAGGCVLWGLYWPFSYAVQTGIVAKADRSGKAIVLCGLAPSVGMVLGSYLGGLIFQNTQHAAVAIIATIGSILGAGGLLVLLPRRAVGLNA